MGTTQSSSSTVKQKESWQNALKRVRSNLHFATSFTTVIRTLLLNLEENKANGVDLKKMNSGTNFLVGRLLNAQSVLSPFYYLTLTLKESEIANKSYVSRKDLLNLYKLDEIAVVLALVYTFHRLRRGCDPEEWQRYARHVHEAIDIGAHIGTNFSEVGMASGILLNGMRHLALAIFMRGDLKIFKNYRRDVKIKKGMFDTKMEMELFGCTHIEIATTILQSLGFGVDYAERFYRGLTTHPQKELDQQANQVRISLLWAEALQLGTKPPAIKGEDQILASDDVLDRIISLSGQVREGGSKYSWLGRGKVDISKKQVPQLYLRKNKASENSEKKNSDEATTKIFLYDELPEHVKSNFSEEHYEEITEEIQGLLQPAAEIQ